MSDVLAVALGGFGGAILGSVVRPVIEARLDIWRRRRDLRRSALEEQLREVYRPLYIDFVIMPHDDPEHYFTDWEEAEFATWLNGAINMMIPKLHLLPDDVLQRVHGMREGLNHSGPHIERDVRWLYQHISDKFKEIRKELEIR